LEFLKFPTHNSEELLKNSAEESRFQNTSEHPRTLSMRFCSGGWGGGQQLPERRRKIVKSIEKVVRNLIIEIKKKHTLSKTVNHVLRIL